MAYRHIFPFSSILILLTAITLLTCSKDSKTSTGPENDMALVGTWELTKTISEYQGETEILTESQIDSIGLVWAYKIEDDGTIELTTNLDGSLVTLQGTWSTSANQLTMMLTGPSGESPDPLVFEYLIDGNILQLNWDIPSGAKFYAEFTRQ